jgi:hypothetical protein
MLLIQLSKLIETAFPLYFSKHFGSDVDLEARVAVPFSTINNCNDQSCVVWGGDLKRHTTEVQHSSAAKILVDV